MPETLWVEITPWRGARPWIDRTLFGPVLRLGWLGVGVSKHRLSDWIAEWHDKLKSLAPEGDR